MVTKDHLKLVLSGDKKFLKIQDVRFCNPPTFDEVSVTSLYDRVIRQKGMAELFPDKFPKGRTCCRSYMFNCWNTLHHDQVQAVISHASNMRYAIDSKKNEGNSIKMSEHWMEELERAPFVSKHKGRMSALLKAKSKVSIINKPRKKFDVFDFAAQPRPRNDPPPN
jgi:hypothetical protein